MTKYKNCILCGDSAQVLKTIPNNHVDLTVTSPPYDDLRDYRGYNFDFQIIAKELFRVTKDGGVIVWVVGDSTKDGSETGTSFKQALFFKEIGFKLHDTMIYQKDGSSMPNPNRYFQVFEYMFIFSKGPPKTANLLKDKKNTQANTSTNRHYRDKETGKTVYRDDKQKTGLFGRRLNIWKYACGYMKNSKDVISFEHPATFPEALASDHIRTWSNEGDLVLDPFAGSGTTLKMAKLNRRDYLGIEISPEYCEIINKRLEKHNNQPLESWLTG